MGIYVNLLMLAVSGVFLAKNFFSRRRINFNVPERKPSIVKIKSKTPEAGLG
jgi:hypothetical protein